MATIVLDKCFLQAASWQTVCELAKDHKLIVNGSLFHELLSGDQEARRRAFAKFPRHDNPVRLLEDVSSMLAHEKNTHTPAGDMLDHTLKFLFRFNPALQDIGYELPPEVRQAVADNEKHTRRKVERYIERTNAIVPMFEKVTIGSDSYRKSALAEIEQEIAEPENVLNFYRTMNDPKLPPPELLTPSWATFRFYQTALLFSLHTIHRHRGPIPAMPSAREIERLEHDVHDHMALCTGVMAGGLATEEKKLRQWCSLVRPQSLIVSAQQVL